MENLQEQANSIAEAGRRLQEEAKEQQAYYQSQLLVQARRANFLRMMNSFFPRTASCTSNTIGSSTYTRCY